MLHVNSQTAGADVHVPFGGIKASGFGPHEQGPAAVEFYTTKLGFWSPFMEGDPPTFAGVNLGRVQIFLERGTPSPEGCSVYFVVGERQLLLADEPSGALDSANGEAVMRLIRAACRRGVACVLVTHDAQLASWADRVIFLRDGRVVDQTARPPGPESLLAPSQSS